MYLNQPALDAKGDKTMGADIHVYIEYKDKNGDWRNFGEFDMLGRNYDIFGLLAGVRGSFDPVISPKGLPKDRSSGVLAASEWWGSSSHTHSYLNTKEIKKVLKKLKKYSKKDEKLNEVREYYKPMFKVLIKVLDVLGESRIVFWFDS